MSWSDVYLLCFCVGLGLSVVSFLLGSVRIHVPHVHVHGGHFHAGHGASHGHAVVAKGGKPGHSWFDFGTLSAFLAWFGGTGYLLEEYSSLAVIVVLGFATAAGIGGAAIVFWFLTSFLLKHEAPLDPADYDMTGVLGRLSVPIRQGGTGELIYSQEGTRRVCAARSEDGAPIAKGSEVVVSHYDKGIAYVKAWEDPTLIN